MKSEKKYSGVVVPMMTPFTAQHTIDADAVHTLVNHLIAGHTQPFVLGTTGEAPSISFTERKKMVVETVKAVHSRTLVYAGIPGNSLADAIEEGKSYYDLGVDVLVATMPSYYPVAPDQVLRYFETLAAALPGPLVVYNIPSTTHLSIPLNIIDQLSQHPNIVALKDSERGLERMEEAIALWKDRQDFSYLLGWAVMSQQAIAQGADGIVPSSGNIAPAVYRQLYEAAVAGNTTAAVKAQEKGDRISAMYQKDRLLSQSLAAFKAMLAAYGLCGPAVLPPLYRLSEAAEKQLMQNVQATFGDLKTINSSHE
jgi:dihydrodipicolinate synthase/N-acetylneuraminate lyase